MSRFAKLAPWALVGIGLLQPLGYLTGLTAVRGIGMATVASPLPLVFSHFRGVETFAADFELELLFADGRTHREPITPALYARLGGPYNRRNTYGAVISYGPAFTEPQEKELLRAVLSYGFCRGGPLAVELGTSEPVREARIHVRSRTAGSDDTAVLAVECDR